jgi:tetratricopeptide (TPR) repeat protein
MSRFALVAVLAAASLAPRAATAASDRDEQLAMKHYRAGTDALTHELYEQAEEEFKAAVKLDPLLVGAHHGLGRTMMATKRYPEAVDAFVAGREAWTRGQALAAEQGMQVQRRLDDQIKALQDDVSTARRQSSGPGAQNIQDAIVRNEEQIKTLQSLRKRGSEGPLPTPHWLSLSLGSAYFRTGNLAEAEKGYRAALEEKPDLGEGHLNLAVVCMLTGRLDEADSEVKLAEKAGVKVPQGLKDDIVKRRAAAKP